MHIDTYIGYFCSMRIKCLFILLLIIPQLGFSQVIPETRITNWSHAGLTDSIAYDQNTVSLTLSVSESTGVTDVQPEIQAALDSIATLGGGTVKLPPGTFRIGSSLAVPSNVRLKGSTSDSTFLSLYNNSGITMHGTNTSTTISLTAGFTKGSDSLLLDSTNHFNTGDFVEIRQDNGSWDTQPATWADNVTGMISRIEKIENQKVFLSNKLSMDLDSALNPRITIINPVINAALECLYIENKDSIQGGTAHNISLSYAWNCRVTGVESAKSAGAHIRVGQSAQNNFYGNYLHESYQYDGGGTRGYGLMFTHYASYNKAENNIFSHLRHAIMTKAGANSNVIAYNYSRDVYRSEQPQDASGDISLHGHYSFANLFESNIVQNIFIDHYWGPSGPYNTLFRNRTENYGIIMTLGNPNATDKQNFVGNEVSMSSNINSQYMITGTDHFKHGNNVKGMTMPAGTGSLADSSMYLNSAPEFWDHNIPWPAIGYPNALDDNSIPAKNRFVNEKALTLCSCENIADTTTNIQQKRTDNFKLYPNPAKTSIFVETDLGEVALKIYSSTGTLIYSGQMAQNHKKIEIISFADGMYILELRKNEHVTRKKFMKF